MARFGGGGFFLLGGRFFFVGGGGGGVRWCLCLVGFVVDARKQPTDLKFIDVYILSVQFHCPFFN